ncbi:MAG: DNA topoisomerase VI subunit B, partial [Ignisphaera sp.]
KTMISETKVSNLAEFLAIEFQGIGEVTAQRFLQLHGFDPNTNVKDLTSEDIEKLVKALREFNELRKPRADHLSPIGAELIKIGLKQILKPEFVDSVTRKPVVYEGHALIVEVGIGYGGAIQPCEQPILLRYANKIPLLYDEKSDVSWKVVSENIDWRYYEIEFPAPIAILVHVCGTKIPYKGVGKESIADVPVLEHEIEEGIRHVARSLKQYLAKKQREEEAMRKAYSILKYIPEIASALAVFASSNPEKVDASIFEDKLFQMVKAKYGEVLKSISSIRDIVVFTE